MAKRVPHYMKGLSGAAMPSELLFFDTETNQRQVDENTVSHHLKMGWAAYVRRLPSGKWSRPLWHRFSTIDGFWNWAESLLHGKCKLYSFCHNGSFDLPVLDAFAQLQGRDWKLQSACIDSPPVILKWRRKQQTIQFIDTLNIWGMALSELGKNVGLPKLKMPGETASAARWDAYCRRDVKVIMRAVLKWIAFLQDNDFGGFAPTLASQAMRAYRRRFMTEKILVDNDTEALELSRSCYRGGRVECFRIGEIDQPTWLVDINSMYPHVMAEHYMPARLIGRTNRATIADVAEWLEDRCVCADVELDTALPAYPTVLDGRLVFPVGNFSTFLTSPELAYALAHGHLVRVNRVAVYERAKLFTHYVETLYAMRLQAKAEGREVDAWLFKLLLNCLYGKFGQSGRVYHDIGTTKETESKAWHELDIDTGRILQYRQLGGLLQVFHNEAESRGSHPAIAAHVTAHARMLLWSLIMKAGRPNVFYCDTDSLLVNLLGLNALSGELDKTRLGKLKVEREVTRAVLNGPKDYRFDEIVTLKGVRPQAQWVDGYTVQQDMWSSLKGLLRLGDITAPRTELRTKVLTREYKKGLVMPDGTVSPFTLGA